jgi:type III secretion protein Y
MKLLSDRRGGDVIGSDHRDLLHALGHLYLQHGQNRRALILLLVAARTAPEDVGLQRSLAYALVANGSGAAALAIIDALEASGTPEPPLRLLRSRALLLEGRREEARRCFRQFIAERRQQL